MTNYRSYFGLKSEPFTNDISTKNLLKLPAMVGVKERIDYVSNIGGIMLITGEVGSGKSTAIRWALSHYHPSQYNILSIIATSGAVIDIYRQIAWALNLDIFDNNFPVKQRQALLRSTLPRDNASQNLWGAGAKAPVYNHYLPSLLNLFKLSLLVQKNVRILV